MYVTTAIFKVLNHDLACNIAHKRRKAVVFKIKSQTLKMERASKYVFFLFFPCLAYLKILSSY